MPRFSVPGNWRSRTVGMRRLSAASTAIAACACMLLAGQVRATEVPVGSAEPTGRIIPVQTMATLTDDNASPLAVSSDDPAMRIRLTVYRKTDRSDAVTTECTAPCRLLVPKRYGFALTAEVPGGRRLTTPPVAFAWKQPFWCRGGVLCKTELQPRALVLATETDR